MCEGRELDPGAVLPQPLQVVVGAVVVVLDMHNHVLVIEQYPAGLPHSLSPYGLVTGLTQLPFDTVDDRLDLALVRPGGDHEHVSDHHTVGDIERHHVDGLLLRRRTCGPDRDIPGLGRCCLSTPSHW